MPRISNSYHKSVVEDAVSSVGTSYDTAKYHLHDLIPDVTYSASAPGVAGVVRKTLFGSKIEGLTILATSISGAASLTVRICGDEEGVISLMPDTTATISLGIADATAGTVAYSVGVPFFGIVNSDSKFWVFVKTDAGTVTLERSILTWSE